MSYDVKNVSWPGWEFVRLIGRGSFGAVYEIQRDVLGETEKAALKVISIPQNSSDIEELYSEGYDDESITNTFEGHLKSIVAEYSLMRKMNGSSNIVNCDDIRYVQHNDGIGWDIFIKMELLTPLTKAVSVEFSEQTVINIAKDMCVALELCKKHNIVHRDIKPQNIFVSSNGDYKLGDFGIAKTMEKTMGGTKIGTYKYMAPEIYHYQPYGSTADIYSLGLVLYWLMNEHRMPFMPLPPEKIKAGVDEQAKERRLSGEKLPMPLHGSEALKRIVLKACAYNVQDRYQSATDMLQDLKALIHKEQSMLESESKKTYNVYLKRVLGESSSALNIYMDGRLCSGDINSRECVIRLSKGLHKITLKSQVPNKVSAAREGCELPTAADSVTFDITDETTLTYYISSEKAIAEKSKRKSKGLAIFLTIFPYTGWFGVHEFYLGNKKRGIIKLCTLNYIIFGWLFDIIMMIFGKYKDINGNSNK